MTTFVAPAVIEYPQDSQTQKAFYTNKNVTLHCTATGNQRQIFWSKDRKAIGDYFEKPQERIISRSGKVKYGQDKHLVSTLRWNPPGPSVTCDSASTHDGVYTCTATATAGGKYTSDSRRIVLEVECKFWPICFIIIPTIQGKLSCKLPTVRIGLFALYQIYIMVLILRNHETFFTYKNMFCCDFHITDTV